MSKLSYYLDCRTQRSDGTSALKLMVNSKAGNIMVSTGIYLTPQQWSPQGKIIVKHPNRAFLNSHLTNLLCEAEDALMKARAANGRALTREEMKQVIYPIYKEDYVTYTSVRTVFERTIKDPLLKKRTHELYSCTLSKIESFIGHSADKLRFEDITVGWLHGFDEWLVKSCPSANARAIHMRNLRKVFNSAIDDEITSNYPFRKFRIRKDPTRKRSLTVEQLRSLATMELKPWQKRYVDTFMLMFYMMGINAVDLLNATPAMIYNGRFDYCRHKTNRPYSIKIEPEAQEIIDRYKGRSHLLSFCDNGRKYKNFLKRMNMCLNKLIPGCSSYYARHSSATIAAEIDVPLDTIANMLGHTDTSRRVTLVYVDFNMAKVDEANRRVIDYVLGKGKYKKNKVKGK